MAAAPAIPPPDDKESKDGTNKGSSSEGGALEGESAQEITNSTQGKGAIDAPPTKTTTETQEWMYGPEEDPKVNSDGSTGPNTWTTPNDFNSQAEAQDKLDPFKPAEGKRPITIPPDTEIQKGTTPGGEGPYNGNGGADETLIPGGLPPGSAGEWQPLPPKPPAPQEQPSATQE